MISGMSMTKARFRQLVAERREGFKSGAPRYPAKMKRFAVECARVAIANGDTLASAARELSISDITLSKWVQAAEVETAFASVVVEAEEAAPSSGELTLTTPDGYEITGLDVRSVAELLRAFR